LAAVLETAMFKLSVRISATTECRQVGKTARVSCDGHTFIAVAVNGVGRKFGSGLRKAVPGLSRETFAAAKRVTDKLTKVHC
jgi:hypothetical protein